jgi:hypothetical protein
MDAVRPVAVRTQYRARPGQVGLMAVSELRARVASVALAAAAVHGFALGGGQRAAGARRHQPSGPGR